MFALARDHLAFLDHVHEFDTLQCCFGRPKGFETEHRPYNPFDRSMILLDQIVQVFDLSYLDLIAGFLLECFDGCGIGRSYRS
jgi:hypothetical protein